MSSTQPPAADDHLPARLTELVGRERDVAAACALLRHDVRLLTLTGAGGIGKTRLAVAIAHTLRSAFADGVCFVSLAPITDPDLVVSTIAHALGLRDGDARSPWDRLTDHLRGRQRLLVLDNFEQVAAAAPIVAELLLRCPAQKVLVTSRALLHLSVEHEFPLRPLALPDPAGVHSIARLAAAESVELFVARARAARPDFVLTEANVRTVAAICRRLDGLPLAIELAAARIRHLPPATLLNRLERRLTLLTGGPRDALARYQTMRSTIAWSYDLLNNDEQILFRCLAVFVGGFSLDAIEAVSREPVPIAEREVEESRSRDDDYPLDFSTPRLLDLLASLLDKSLLQVETLTDGGARFGMLETIREFGLEQLEGSGEAEASAVRRAHATWCLALAERTEPELHGPAQHRWWRLLETEHDNLRTALSWLEQIGDAEASLRLAGALASFWWFGGHLREGSAWLERSLARAGGAPALVRARALEGAGFLAQPQGDDARAVAFLEQSLTLYREAADAKGIAATLYSLGVAAEDRGAYLQATALLTEAAARAEELGDHRTKTFAILHLGIVACGRGDLRAAVAQSEAGIALAHAIDSTLGGLLGAFCLALVASARGEYARAAGRYREIVAWLDAAGVFGDSWPRRSADSAGRTLAAVAALAVGCGETKRAARLFGAAAADYDAIGQPAALPERVPFERTADAARQTLGPVAFEAAWAAGREMTPAEARIEVEAVLTTAASSPAQETRPSAPAGLSPREQEILRFLAEGRTDREIGAALFISHRTVMGHVGKILSKLDVPTRTAAVNYAVRHGLL